MYPNRKTNPEVQPQPERRCFSADYKRRIVIEADQCRHGEGEMGRLLRREGLTYTQVTSWRKAHRDGTSLVCGGSNTAGVGESTTRSHPFLRGGELA